MVARAQMETHDVYIPENEIQKLRVQIEEKNTTIASLSREKQGLLESIQQLSKDKSSLLTKLEIEGQHYSEASVENIKNEMQQTIDSLTAELENVKKMIALLNKIIELSGIMNHA